MSHGGPPWGQKYEADSEAKVLINKIISPSDLQIVSGHTSGTCTLVHQFKVLCQDGREPINGECAPACEAGKIKVGTVCVMKMISATFSSIKLEKVLRKHNPDLIGVRSATGSDELVLQPNVEFALDAESKIAYIGEPKGWLSIGDFQAKNGSSTGEMHAPLSFEFANIPDGTKLEANIAVNGTSERMALNLQTVKVQATVESTPSFQYSWLDMPSSIQKVSRQIGTHHCTQARAHVRTQEMHAHARTHTHTKSRMLACTH